MSNQSIANNRQLSSAILLKNISNLWNRPSGLLSENGARGVSKNRV